ncbi:30S ribosomal protein S20 [Alkalicoccus urumqiensis]|uniref:Small ribosomal subunit protein bS20 n=1 Tax=Alkalicoccus urumqiensis TaxID=1548213 RepID=A0A2P6MFN3_ALKUR|nr:30S ribosomal protein S20 [Alkalicoccus urumqiensis]PRO65088.1 30S ribosomal protein S20 [Alkalicoccus urumqiensis]
MANIKSAKKRVIVNEISRKKNFAFKSDLRNSIKGFYAKVEEKDTAKANELFVEATSKIDKAVNKGLMHKNAAARRKSKLQKSLDSLSA